MPEPTSKPRAVVFVHGFMSSKDCWADLLKLLEADARIGGRFELLCFEYATSVVQLRLLRRIPSILEIGRALGAFLEAPPLAGYREITLVGHSQGGLVIQSHVVDKLRRNRSVELSRIRQIVLMATPNHGSAKASLARRVFYTFFRNPQELALRIFDPQIDEVVNEMDERVESAKPGAQDGWPIPIQCFWGAEDDVVLPASARGPFNNALPLDGDHSSILSPADQADLRYVHVSDALAEPAGHPHVWEIDSFETTIKVAPLAGDAQRVVARYGEKTREFVCDNVASITRRVTFSRKNRCTRQYRLRYGTRNEGFVKATLSHENEASDQDLQVYEDYGIRIVFDFTPRAAETFWMDVEVFKGFDPGHRDVHAHLGRREAYYRTVRVALDLTAYLEQGYAVSEAPVLYFQEEDRGHDDMCRRRGRDTPLRCVQQGRGVWQWEVQEVWGGIVDVVWDVAAPAAAAATTGGSS